VFGHNERLARRLKEKGGIRAWATVLDSEREWASTGGANVSPGQAGSITIHQRLRLRVEPDGSPPFETTVKQVFNDSYGWHVPQEGYSVAVLYDAADHSKLVIDMEAMPVAPGVGRDQAIQRDERTVAQMQDLLAQRQQLAQMPAPQGAAEVPSAPATNDLLADASRQGRGTSSGPDVADEITKLAALRDRGVLTEAEFAAAKAKILGAD